MSVKLIDNDDFYGYRVRRSINGHSYQEYFSLKENGKRIKGTLLENIKKEAITRDGALIEEKKRLDKKLKATRCFSDDGSVKGINFLHKTEKSGTITPVYQVGISSVLEGRIVSTSFSLNAHGEDNAWAMAVDFYAKHKVIRKNSKLFHKLKASKPLQVVKH